MSSVVFDGAAKEEYSPVDSLSYYSSNYNNNNNNNNAGGASNPNLSYGNNNNSNNNNNARQTHHPIGGRMFSSATPFGDGGFADEPPLLEELGVNFSHMRQKVS